MHSIKTYMYIGMCMFMSIYGVNSMHKVELHQGMQPSMAEGSSQLELAQLFVYVHNNPQVHELQVGTKDNGWQFKTYLFVHTALESNAQKMFQELAHKQYEHFAFAVEPVQQPLVGVKVEISYDPRYVALNYDTFDTIHRHKGVVFRFINRPLLQRLATQEQPLLQLAQGAVNTGVSLDMYSAVLVKV